MSLAVRVYPSAGQRGVLEEMRSEIERLANVSTLEVLSEPADPTGSARLAADGAEVLIPLAGVLDPEVEQARLHKRLAAIQADVLRGEAKLGNEGFVAGAPPAIVERERDRLAALKDEAAAIEAQLEELG
jgi:valyl-tRNA synthetase